MRYRESRNMEGIGLDLIRGSGALRSPIIALAVTQLCERISLK